MIEYTTPVMCFACNRVIRIKSQSTNRTILLKAHYALKHSEQYKDMYPDYAERDNKRLGVKPDEVQPNE